MRVSETNLNLKTPLNWFLHTTYVPAASFFELSFRSREIDLWFIIFQICSLYIKFTVCFNNSHFVILLFSFYLLEIHFSSGNHCCWIFLYNDVLPVGLSPDTCHALVLTLRQCLTLLTAKITLKMCSGNNCNFALGLSGINKSSHWASKVVSSVWRQMFYERL